MPYHISFGRLPTKFPIEPFISARCRSHQSSSLPQQDFIFPRYFRVLSSKDTSPRRIAVEDFFECKTGMKSVDRKLRKFNRDRKWMDYRLSQRIDEHLSRMAALHHGGDCYVAGLAGAKPNDRLWTLGKHVRNNVFWLAHMSSDNIIERARVRHTRKHIRRIRIIRASSGGG